MLGTVVARVLAPSVRPTRLDDDCIKIASSRLVARLAASTAEGNMMSKINKHWVSVALAIGALLVGCTGHESGGFIFAIVLIEFFA